MEIHQIDQAHLSLLTIQEIITNQKSIELSKDAKSKLLLVEIF